MSKKPLKILIDADMIVFEVCSAVETSIDWGDDLWTLHADAGEAKDRVDNRVQSIIDKILLKLSYEGTYEILMCFSDTENFRKKILPTYKANRIGKRKPICYQAVVEWVQENYTCYQRPALEADDCIGILATIHKGTSVAVSGDKDFRSIPCTLYNYQTGKFYATTEEEADRWHLTQTLIGDTTDNYTGCVGVGKVKAKKILGDNPTWESVLQAFIQHGMTEHDAITQARVARILRASDYDFKSKKPILWSPPN